MNGVIGSNCTNSCMSTNITSLGGMPAKTDKFDIFSNISSLLGNIFCIDI